MSIFFKQKKIYLLFGLVVLTISALLLTIHYYPIPSSTPTQVFPTEKWAALLGEQWLQDTAWFLEINYVEKEDTAGFGQFSKRDFRPNLYTTHQAIRLLQNAGENIENPEEIIHWINSIQQDDGSFNCPADHFDHAPPILEIYWAVSSLKRLESSPRHPDKIVDFILSLQKENGGFIFNREGDADYWATAMASEILLALGQDKLENPLRQAADFLKQRLDLRLQEELEPQAEKIEKLEDVLILRTILELTPNHTLPEKYAPVLAKAGALIIEEDFVKETLFWPGFSLAHIANQLLDIAALGVSINLDLDKVKQLTVTEVFPRVPEEGFHLFQGIIDTNLLTINNLVELAKNVEEQYPHLQEVIHKVNRYRIEGGWLTFMHLSPSIRSTYGALFVAREIGYTQFDREKVQKFVLNLMENDSASFEEKYYALMSLRLLVEQPNKVVIRNFERDIIAQALHVNVSDSQSLYQIAYLARIVKELNLEIPLPLQDKLKEMLQSLRVEWENAPLARMEFLYQVALAQYITGKEIFPSSEVRKRLKALWSPQGGFKAAAHFHAGVLSDVPAEPSIISLPDIPIIQSTYLATQIMSMLPDTNIITEDYKKEMTKYILQTKSRFGFDEVTADMHEKYEGVISLEPTWGSTMAALKLLRFISLPDSMGK